MDWRLLWTTLGLVLIVEGLPYFLFPENARRALRWLVGLSPDALRLLGLTGLVTGTAVLVLGRLLTG